MGKTVAILGGGSGGLVVANKLRKALGRDCEIVLVDKEKTHIYYPSFPWILAGWRTREEIQKPFSLLGKKGIKFLNAEVEKIDFSAKTLLTSVASVPYDYLVISLGAGIFPDRLKGFAESALNFYDLNGAEKIREAIQNFSQKRIVILISSRPFKCPAAPYEAALMLAEYFRKNKKEVEIEVVTPETLPMAVAGPEIGNMVVSLIQSRGIRFTPQHQPLSVDSVKKEISFQNEKMISYDLLIGIPPHGLPTVLANSPILGESGWVKVNARTMKTDIENVYALGDVTAIPLPVGQPLPKAGVFAHFQADVVAHQIASEIKGVEPKEEFDGRGYCFIELGDGRAGYAGGNFYTAPKPVVNLKKPSRIWHLGKVVFEKWWMWRWF